jgi:hypothetical protein
VAVSVSGPAGALADASGAVAGSAAEASTGGGYRVTPTGATDIIPRMSRLSVYENGSSVKSVVGATFSSTSSRAGRLRPTARQPDGRLMIAEVLPQRHGSVV